MAGVGGNWAKLQSSLSGKRARDGGSEALQPAKKRKKQRKQGDHNGRKPAVTQEQPKTPKKKQRKKQKQKKLEGGAEQQRREKQHEAGGKRGGGGDKAAPPPGHRKRPTAAMKRRNVRPAPFVLKEHSGFSRMQRVLRPTDARYEELRAAVYADFAVDEKPGAGSEGQWARDASEAFRRLTAEGFFKYDVVQPGRVEDQAATYVRRCVVGDRGMTYKYLGLRVFAYPWAEGGDSSAIAAMHSLNEEMKRKTQRHLDDYHKGQRKEQGSCQYNLTLINEMQPLSAPEGKEPPFPSAGRATVSWHQDTSLEDYSSVAIFHTIENAGAVPWSIGLRVIYDKKTPALWLPLPSGATYYMLDTFNHHHQHVVIAGDGLRYSSTHRVATTATSTWRYIWAKAQQAAAQAEKILTEVREGGRVEGEAVEKVQDAHSEVESEWLRQWYWQGSSHAGRQAYWKKRMEEKLLSVWEKLEAFAADLLAAVRKKKDTRLAGVLTEALVKRQEMRKMWERKLEVAMTASATARKLSAEDAPIPSPLFPLEGRTLGRDLTTAVKNLREVS